MKQLKIKILAKIFINFQAINITFLREQQTNKEISVPYTNGGDFVLSAGQVLYTAGTLNQVGYLEIKVVNNTTLTSSGNLLLSITHYPSASEANKTVTFNIDSSAVNIVFYYNSAPAINDIIVQTNNRTPYTFTTQDFLANVSDYDNDQIAEISLIGDLTGYTLDNTPVVSDSWISMADVALDKLVYTPLNQDAYYEKDIQYKAKDIHGNISIN